MTNKSQAVTRMIVLFGYICALGVGAPAQRKIVDEAKKKDRQVEEPKILDEAKKKERTFQAYPVICRGGRGMFFRLYPTTGGEGQLVIGFQPGTAPAGPHGEGVLPGHCSWVDRGFRAGEPPRICHDVGTFDVNIGSQATVVRADYAHYLSVLNTGQTFVLQVFNGGRDVKEGQGCLQVLPPEPRAKPALIGRLGFVNLSGLGTF